MALEARLWNKIITEGGRRFMSAWREQDKHVASLHKGDKEAGEARKFVTAPGAVKPSKRRRLECSGRARRATYGREAD